MKRGVFIPAKQEHSSIFFVLKQGIMKNNMTGH
jgi:hypothetical protein